MTTKAGRVLIVEDESLVALFVEDCLRDAGYDVVATASNLQQALVLARSLEFDAAVLDINLKGDFSFPVADLLFQRNIPFVVCTGYNTTDMPLAIRTALALSKPVEPKRLTAALAKCMGGRIGTTKTGKI
jgi:CheY-like chemotaxis protein